MFVKINIKIQFISIYMITLGYIGIDSLSILWQVIIRVRFWRDAQATIARCESCCGERKPIISLQRCVSQLHIARDFVSKQQSIESGAESGSRIANQGLILSWRESGSISLSYDRRRLKGGEDVEGMNARWTRTKNGSLIIN